jgi:hypothetical protein
MNQLLKMTDEKYFAMTEYINASMLKTLHSKSDLHLDSFKGNKSTNFGSLCHTYILEKELFKGQVMPQFIPLDKKNIEKYMLTDLLGKVTGDVDSNFGRTKEGREMKEAWELANPGSISKADMESLEIIEQNIQTADNTYYDTYLTGGQAEMVGLVEDFQIDLGDGKTLTTKVKVKFDYIKEIDGVVYITDLKTTSDASLWGFKGSLRKFGYDIQGALYVDAARAIFKGKKIVFQFLAVESDYPYAPAWYKLSKETYLEGVEKVKNVIVRADALKHGAPKIGYPASQRMMAV